MLSPLSPEAAEFYARVFYPARRGCFAQLRRAGCSEGEAEEVFMATLQKVMRKIDPMARGFLPPQMVNYLKVACRRRLLDNRRRGRTIREEPLGLSLSDQADLGAKGTEQIVEELEAAAIAREALLCLPPRDRLVYFLRSQLDFSPAEVQRAVPSLSLRQYRNAIERSTPRARAAYERIESGDRCGNIEGLLRALPSAGLGAEERRTVAAHLSHCRSCRRAAAEIKRDRA